MTEVDFRVILQWVIGVFILSILRVYQIIIAILTIFSYLQINILNENMHYWISLKFEAKTRRTLKNIEEINHFTTGKLSMY